MIMYSNYLAIPINSEGFKSLAIDGVLGTLFLECSSYTVCQRLKSPLPKNIPTTKMSY